jgi:hypothetical protein
LAAGGLLQQLSARNNDSKSHGQSGPARLRWNSAGSMLDQPAKDDLATAVKSMMWEPIYSSYRRLPIA